LRDVGQNHLLQLAALFTMDRPNQFTAEAVREQRAAALRRLQISPGTTVRRGQYQGYRDAVGVAADSLTETYCDATLTVADGVLTGVPITLSTGKALPENVARVEVRFRHPEPCLCPADQHVQNILRYEIQPQERITLQFLVKNPGHDFVLSEQDLVFDYAQAYKDQEGVEAYEQLLLDIIAGDQTLFISTAEVLEQWRIVEPVLQSWNQAGATDLVIYDAGQFPLFTTPDLGQAVCAKELVLVGLGKMGAGLAEQLLRAGWRIIGSDPAGAPQHLQDLGITSARDLTDAVHQLQSSRRVIWLMVPAGELVDQLLFGANGLAELLQPGDIVIDGGNSRYTDSQVRAEKLAARGIEFVDVGVSGGPAGARTGACLMIGGSVASFQYLRSLFETISLPGGAAHFAGAGAGHFVKMVHNGIEYGMMQAIAEGFAIMKESDYDLDLQEVARLYNRGSVIRSALVGWLENAYREHGMDLADISGKINFTGEGEWTIQAADVLGIPVPVIAESFEFRKASHDNPSYTGQIVSALRGQFGGHDVRG
jgi:6-phosphogluconate dehydrogenase